MGIVIINVLPFSTSLTTEILPLCSSINPLAIYKPNPLPSWSTLRLDTDCTLLNLSNILLSVLLLPRGRSDADCAVCPSCRNAVFCVRSAESRMPRPLVCSCADSCSERAVVLCAYFRQTRRRIEPARRVDGVWRGVRQSLSGVCCDGSSAASVCGRRSVADAETTVPASELCSDFCDAAAACGSGESAAVSADIFPVFRTLDADTRTSCESQRQNGASPDSGFAAVDCVHGKLHSADFAEPVRTAVCG